MLLIFLSDWRFCFASEDPFFLWPKHILFIQPWLDLILQISLVMHSRICVSCEVVMLWCCDVWWVTSSTRRHLTYQSCWGWNNQLWIILHTIKRAREGDTMFCKIVNTRWVITKISCVCYDTEMIFWESRLHLRLRRFLNAKSEKAERL